MRKKFQLVILVLFELGVSFSAPAQQTHANATGSPSSVTPSPSAVASVPDDAVDLGGGKYRWTDEQGRKWLYTRLPMGVTRMPEHAANTRPKGVPEEAERAKDGTWLYTDSDGKRWKYVAIPTGMVRVADTSAASGRGERAKTPAQMEAR